MTHPFVFLSVPSVLNIATHSLYSSPVTIYIVCSLTLSIHLLNEVGVLLLNDLPFEFQGGGQLPSSDAEVNRENSEFLEGERGRERESEERGGRESWE